MSNIKKIVFCILLCTGFYAGFLNIYRATLKPADMTVVTGTVVDKNIYYLSGSRGRDNYCLSFTLAGRKDRIAIRLGEGSRVEAANDSTCNLVDTGKTYTFYLDPTFPTSNGDNWGIDKIDYNGVQVFRASTRATLVLGIFVCLFSVAAFIAVLKAKKKPANVK